VIVAFTVGDKCAVMLPKDFINSQLTPAKGLIVNKFIDSRSLVLVEEVWQFKGFPDAALSEKIFPSGRIRSNSWGWLEVPNLVEKENDYLVVKAYPDNLMLPTTEALEALVKRSISSFKTIYGL